MMQAAASLEGFHKPGDLAREARNERGEGRMVKAARPPLAGRWLFEVLPWHGLALAIPTH